MTIRAVMMLLMVAPGLMGAGPEPSANTGGPVVPALETGAVKPTATPAVEGPAVISKRRARYTILEEKAVRLSREWAAKRVAPARGEGGLVTYVYGGVLPSVVCSPLYVCDVALQPGETLMELHAGDQARWKLSVAQGGKETHVLVKPTDAGLRTNLLMLTDRRTYVVQLVSDTRDWMPRVAFSYPEDLQAQVAAIRQKAAKQQEAETLPSGESVLSLDFEYQIIGDEPNWRPVRVYSDGVKTYIEFPKAMKNDEAPALLALGPGSAEQLVNYRMDGTRFIVDRVLQRAVLLSGVGSTQQKVELVHGAPKPGGKS